VDIRDARHLFPATAGRAYFNTAAVGLASQLTADTYHEFIDQWTATRPRFQPRGRQAAGNARSAVASDRRRRLRHRADPSVSSAAGLVAAQFGPASPGATAS
jgi:hypothetical protein